MVKTRRNTAVKRPKTDKNGASYLTRQEADRLVEEWRQYALSGAKDLQYAYLTKADLHGADLSGANLTGATFLFADLRQANLQNCRISLTDFTYADLTGANLNWASIGIAPHGQDYSAIFAPALRLVYEGPFPDETRIDKNRGAYGAVNVNIFNYNLNFSQSKDPDVLGPDENLTNKVEAPPLIYKEIDWTEDGLEEVPFDLFPTSESFRQLLEKNSNSTTSRLFLAKVIREKLR